MRMQWWMAGAFASILVGACGSQQVKEDEVKLGRLPMEQKEDIFTAQHNITVAEANKAAAERSLDETKVFASMADEELAAAKARVQAAKTAVELGQKTGDSGTRRDAARQLDVAERQQLAARTKYDYARRLEDLRRAEIGLAERQLDAARAELAYTRTLALRRNGITPSMNEASVLAERDQTNSSVAEQESKVAALRDNVGRLKVAWEQRRQSFNVASRNVSDLPAIKAPKAPERIAPEPIKTPERDDDRALPVE